MNALVIDPSPDSRALCRSVLEPLGFTAVDEAADGRAARDRASAVRPDLIIVARDLPVIDGLTFVRTIRAHDTATPIIMIAPASDRAAVICAIKAGVSDYLVAPFTPDLLSQRISEALAAAVR